MGVRQNGCFIGNIPLNPIKMDDLGVPLFMETPICPWKVTVAMAGKNVMEHSDKEARDLLISYTIETGLDATPWTDDDLSSKKCLPGHQFFTCSWIWIESVLMLQVLAILDWLYYCLIWAKGRHTHTQWHTFCSLSLSRFLYQHVVIFVMSVLQNDPRCWSERLLSPCYSPLFTNHKLETRRHVVSLA